jgi:pimeloyl-ACP methyl ester carboxylesterase
MIMKTRILLLLTAGLMLAAIPVAARALSANNPQAQVSNTETTCPFGLPDDEVVGKTIVCGELTVPENWQTPGDQEVTISYAILKSPSLSPFPDPVVYLEGGPGASALAGLPMLQRTFADLRRYRDIILYDQRGTAFSSPLVCPAEVEQQSVETPEPIADAAQGVESDIDDLVNNAQTLDGYRVAVNCAPYFAEQGIDLSQYSSANSVQDLLALMDSLDYDAYNIYAISYGTNVALELFRQYEEDDGTALPALRSAILDGNVPPNVDTRGGQALITPSNILRVFATCETDEACAAAFPDIRQRALDLIGKAAEAPLEIGEETISLDELRNVLGAALSLTADDNGIVSGIGAAYLPLMIDELENGITATYAGLRSGALPPAKAAVTPVPVNPMQTIAGETSTLADEARTLGDEIEALSLQTKRAADSLASGQPVSEFFISELRIGASHMDYLTGLFFPTALELALQSEPSREALLDVASAVGPELAALVPLMSDEDIEQTFALLSDVLPTLQPVDGITNSVITCNDRYASFDLENTFETYRAFEAPELIQKVDVAVNDKVDCEAWGLTPESTELTDPVVTDLPIMVSNGSIDSETPVEWGEAAAEGLGNAFFVTFPYYPHGASTQFKCGPAVATAFMMYPEQQPNLACAGELLKNFPFVLPAQE